MEKKIIELHNEGLKPKAIADKLNDGTSYQEVAMIIRELAPKKKEPTGIQTLTAEEYGDYSVANGRSRYGGELGVKTKATIEELRAYINSGWKPSMLMEKWQFDEEDLKQLVWALSKAERRDVPISINHKHDFFR